MKYLYCLYFSVYFVLCGSVLKIEALCPHPDVPANGNYTPEQKYFEPGDEISYSCKKGFALAGKERRICKSNGVWSDHTPFCDHSTPLSQPTITNKGDVPSSILRVLDGKTSTCFDWHNATGSVLVVHLDKTIVVRVVRIFIKKGITKIEVFTGLDNDMKSCSDYHNFIESDRWIEIKCRSNVLSDMMKILVVNQRFISLCEIEVFGREEDSCDRPPSMTVAYGHFEVSRSKATLVCEEGYRSAANNRLVCERNGNVSWTGGRLRCEEILCSPLSSGLPGGEWTFSMTTTKLSAGTKSELKCASGYRRTGSPDPIFCTYNGTWTKTNATCVEEKNTAARTRTIIFGSVGILIVLIIIALLATTIHFIRKQRHKEVVVVYQSQSDGSVPLSGSEMEYSSPHYEQMWPRPPEPPSSQRPLAKLSTMSKKGINQSEDWQNTAKKETLLPDLTFGTMKQSTLYGS